MPLPDTPRSDEALLAMQANWQTSGDAAYASDAAYPSQRAWLASKGTLREYAHAAVAFEQDTGTWKSSVLHGAAILFFENQNYSGCPFVDGATCLDSIEAGLMSGRSITHFSERAGLVTSPFPLPALREATFTGAWGSSQYGIVSWSGHGMPDGAYRTT